MAFQNTITVQNGVVSTGNSSTTPLNSLATFTGASVEAFNYQSVVVNCFTDKDGTLYLEFSSDGTNWDRQISFDVVANESETHRATVVAKYARVRLTNTSLTNQTVLRLQTLLGGYSPLTAKMEDPLTADQDTTITRSVIVGATDGGEYKNVPVTGEGHLEVAIHDPLLPFGSVHSEHLTPVFQVDAIYGINTNAVNTQTVLSGSVTASDSSFVLQTGITANASGTLQSRKRLRYRAGQGSVCRFTALFTTGVANSYQIAGVGHAEDGVYFGYKDTQFGILYENRGVREVQTLTITVASSGATNATVTLNGVAFLVLLTASGNIQRTVYELSQATYTGWTAYPQGATVVFVSNNAGNKAGAFTFSHATAAGTFAETKAGVTATETFVPQSSWNGDKLDGTGASGITADWTKGNVFQIGLQYLGFGAITFKVETTPANSNNAVWTTVHTIKLPNTLTATSFRNPSFPFTASAYSTGSTTNLTVKVASVLGGFEGRKVFTGNRFTYQETDTTVGAANLQVLFTILNSRYFQGIANQGIVNVMNVSAAIKHTNPVTLYLIRNGALAGNPNFASFASNSPTLYDNAATTITYSTNDQLVWSGQIGETGEIDHPFNAELEEFTLQPGEYLTLAAKATTGTPSYVVGSINTREDV